MYPLVLLIFVKRDSEHQLEVYLKHDLVKIYFQLERGVRIPSLPSGFEDHADDALKLDPDSVFVKVDPRPVEI